MMRGWQTMARLVAAGLGVMAWTVPMAASAHTHHHPHAIPGASYGAPLAQTGADPTTPGASVVVIDAQSGQILTAAGAGIPRYPASLTKLMTLDLAFEAIRNGQLSLDTQIPISEHATSVEPVKLGLIAGRTIDAHDAILAMTTMSANDAATALGEYLGGGSEAHCATMMTARAKQLGMTQTQFANASGLPNPNQITTAHDLGLLARDIVANFPEDQQFFEVESFVYHGQTVFSNNAMLRTYPGATGMKTGYTVLARHNLIVSARRGNKVLIGVVLHEPSWGATYAQMTDMLDSGFGGHIAVPEQVHIANALPPAVPHNHALRPAVHGSGTWVAQLGVFRHLEAARNQAVKIRALGGAGVVRVARVQHQGHVMWNAQVAGLTYTAAHQTCSLAASHGDRCAVVGPLSANYAGLSGPSST